MPELVVMYQQDGLLVVEDDRGGGEGRTPVMGSSSVDEVGDASGDPLCSRPGQDEFTGLGAHYGGA